MRAPVWMSGVGVTAIVLATGLVLDAPARAGGEPVTVRLSEWHVAPKPKSFAPGTVRFVVKNVGAETHELVVVRGGRPTALPTQANGAVDEAQLPAGDRVGEVEDVAPKATRNLTLRLTAGRYILFCNLVDTDDPSGTAGFSHFVERMFTTITVKR